MKKYIVQTFYEIVGQEKSYCTSPSTKSFKSIEEAKEHIAELSERLKAKGETKRCKACITESKRYGIEVIYEPAQ